MRARTSFVAGLWVGGLAIVGAVAIYWITLKTDDSASVSSNAAPTDLSALQAELKRLQAENRRLQQTIADLKSNRPPARLSPRPAGVVDGAATKSNLSERAESSVTGSQMIPAWRGEPLTGSGIAPEGETGGEADDFGAAQVQLASMPGIMGQVVLLGEPPPLYRINPHTDPVCARLREHDPLHTENVLVNGDGSLRNAMVFVSSGIPLSGYEQPTQPAVLSFQGCSFQPRVLGMQSGQRLIVRNLDATTHQVESSFWSSHVNGEQLPGA